MYTIVLLTEDGAGSDDTVSVQLNVATLLMAMQIASRWMSTPLNDIPTDKAVVSEVSTGLSFMTTDGTNWYPQFQQEHLGDLYMEGEWYDVCASDLDHPTDITSGGDLCTSFRRAVTATETKYSADDYNNPKNWGVRLNNWSSRTKYKRPTVIWVC